MRLLQAEEVRQWVILYSRFLVVDQCSRLRCDRQKPCRTCVARGAGPSCTYPAGGISQSRLPSSRGATTDRSSLMKRLDRLEGSIISLIHGVGDIEPEQTVTSPSRARNEVSLATATAPNTPASSESGSMHRSSKGTVYVSSAHWTSILRSVSELRDCIGRDRRRDESPDQRDQLSERHTESLPTGGPHLLSGICRILTKAELLSAMPDRSIVDRHVFWYFNRLPFGRGRLLHD